MSGNSDDGGSAAAETELLAVPRSELELLFDVYRLARQYRSRTHGVGVGSAGEARMRLLHVVEGGLDPSDMRVGAALSQLAGGRPRPALPAGTAFPRRRSGSARR